ncbi:MAG: GHMP kinase [Schleiferiaceae bacterium]|nr:GHMP kinase [Schleiferiaceae bacterium]
MIITRTPFRISFVGGGSDLPAFYRAHGGSVLSTTIDKYMYISSHDYFEAGKIRTKYSKTETVSAVSDIEHPILRTIMQRLGVREGLEVSSIADVPAGTGMGSSSSFTVGTLHNLMAREGRLHEVSKAWLGEQACRVELEDLSEPIGKQDQYAAAFGGLNIIDFHANDQVSVSPLNLSSEGILEFSSHLRLYYFGNQRSASSILEEQSQRASEADKVQALKEMVGFVRPFSGYLQSGEWEAIGALMHENWMLKQSLASGISTGPIQEAYAAAQRAGAWGGKLLGAGGGGFMLFVAHPGQHAALDHALSSLRPFPFSLETAGSQVIFNG